MASSNLFIYLLQQFPVMNKKDEKFMVAVQKNPASVIEGIICFFSVWSILGLAGFHTYLTTSNQTTNEDVSHWFLYFSRRITGFEHVQEYIWSFPSIRKTLSWVVRLCKFLCVISKLISFLSETHYTFILPFTLLRRNESEAMNIRCFILEPVLGYDCYVFDMPIRFFLAD